MFRGGKRGAFRGSYCPSSVLTANTGQVCPGQVTCSPDLCLRDLAAWPRVHGDPASWRLSVLKCSVVPPIAPSSHLVRAGWLANRGTEPEATGRVLSKTMGLGPHHPLTHSTAQTTLAGASGPGVRSRLRRGHAPFARPRRPHLRSGLSAGDGKPSTSVPGISLRRLGSGGATAEGSVRVRTRVPTYVFVCAPPSPPPAPQRKGRRDIWAPPSSV